jgi:hypothetical protein
VSEEIGKGIIGALEALSANTSIDETTRKMENLGKSTGKTITGFGVLIAELKKIPGLTGLKDILTGTNIFNLLGKLSEINAQGKYPTAAAKETPAMGRIAAQQRKLEAAALKNSVALRKAENDQLKSKTEVDKLKDKFDLERIGLAAALNYQLTDEQKLRVNALTAIANNNEALAKKYNAELEGVNAAKNLADASNQTAAAVRNLGPALFDAMGNLTARGRNQLAPMEGELGSYRVPAGVTNTGAQTAAAAAVTPQTTATLTLDPNASSDKLVSAIGELVRVNLKYGNKLVPAGTIQ